MLEPLPAVEEGENDRCKGRVGVGWFLVSACPVTITFLCARGFVYAECEMWVVGFTTLALHPFPTTVRGCGRCGCDTYGESRAFLCLLGTVQQTVQEHNVDYEEQLQPCEQVEVGIFEKGTGHNRSLGTLVGVYWFHF